MLISDDVQNPCLGFTDNVTKVMGFSFSFRLCSINLTPGRILMKLVKVTIEGHKLEHLLFRLHIAFTSGMIFVRFR